MPDMAIPSKTLSAIICRQVWMNAVLSVMIPNAIVEQAKKILGPRRRTKMVAGSWKAMEAMVKMKMETL